MYVLYGKDLHMQRRSILYSKPMPPDYQLSIQSTTDNLSGRAPPNIRWCVVSIKKHKCQVEDILSPSLLYQSLVSCLMSCGSSSNSYFRQYESHNVGRKACYLLQCPLLEQVCTPELPEDLLAYNDTALCSSALLEQHLMLCGLARSKKQTSVTTDGELVLP